MGEIQIREVLPGEYKDTGRLTQRAYAEYARPGDPLWDNYFGVLVLAAVHGRPPAVGAAGVLPVTVPGPAGNGGQEADQGEFSDEFQVWRASDPVPGSEFFRRRPPWPAKPSA